MAINFFNLMVFKAFWFLPLTTEVSDPSHPFQKEFWQKGDYFAKAKVPTHNHPIIGWIFLQE